MTVKVKPGEWLELAGSGRCLRLSRERDGRLRVGVEDEHGVAEVMVEADEEPHLGAFIAGSPRP